MPVPETIVELDAALAVIDPQIRGAANQLRMDLDPDSRAEVTGMQVRLQRRRDKEQAARSALQSLLDDGYPEAIVEDISEKVSAVLNAKIAEMDALNKHFTVVAEATTLNPAPGVVEPK